MFHDIARDNCNSRFGFKIAIFEMAATPPVVSRKRPLIRFFLSPSRRVPGKVPRLSLGIILPCEIPLFTVALARTLLTLECNSAARSPYYDSPQIQYTPNRSMSATREVQEFRPGLSHISAREMWVNLSLDYGLSPDQPRQEELRITLQKLPRRKPGSLSASTSAFTFPKVVSGRCLIPS
jgi:hypothetical protein